MYSISAQTLTGEGGVLYNPDRIADEKQIVYDISPVEKELGKAGSFSFTVPKENPLYDTLYRFGTEIFLYKQPGDLIFRGRISSITKDFWCNKTVRCEGALCYLNDIIVRPFTYRTGTNDTFRMSPLDHYGEIAKRYGYYCSAGRSFNFTTNIDSGDILAQTSPYSFGGVSEYITVRNALDDILSLDDLLSVDVIYHGASCSLALSRIPFYTVDVSQTGKGIDLRTNLIDFSEEDNDDDVCTAIIPVGENNRVLYDTDGGTDSDSFQSTNLVSKYGRIEQVAHFESANSDTKLRTSAVLTLRALEREDRPRVTLTAVDLYHLGLNSGMIDIGCTVPLTSQPHGLYAGERYVCVSCSIDIENPENSSYTFRRV